MRKDFLSKKKKGIKAERLWHAALQELVAGQLELLDEKSCLNPHPPKSIKINKIKNTALAEYFILPYC